MRPISTSTFIFIHDQNILVDCAASNKYKDLPYVCYVFLGHRPVDKIMHRKDVIIARNVPSNIEQYPKFCSFTGWYLLWKNKFIHTDYVNLLEYDINVTPQFNAQTESILRSGVEFIGYIPQSLNYLLINKELYLDRFLKSVNKHYGGDVEGHIKALLKEGKINAWSSTSNSTFSKELFDEYMQWFKPIIGDLAGDPMSGHAHERSISIFYLLFKKNAFIAKNLIAHMMMNSHSRKC